MLWKQFSIKQSLKIDFGSIQIHDAYICLKHFLWSENVVWEGSSFVLVFCLLSYTVIVYVLEKCFYKE